jgi:hypothetical protein
MKLPRKYRMEMEHWLELLSRKWDRDFANFIGATLLEYKEYGYDIEKYRTRLRKLSMYRK